MDLLTILLSFFVGLLAAGIPAAIVLVSRISRLEEKTNNLEKSVDRLKDGDVYVRKMVDVLKERLRIKLKCD